MYATVGISTRGENSSLKFLLSLLSHAKAWFCSATSQCISFCSSDHRNLCGYNLSSLSFCSRLYLSLDWNSGGHSGNLGISFNGLSIISWVILNLSGKVLNTGFTFSATSLYFFAKQSCHKLHLDLSPQILGLFRRSKLHWKALKKTFPMILGSPWHLKNPPRDQLISSHQTLNCLYLGNQWSWAFSFDCIIKLSSRQSHRL